MRLFFMDGAICGIMKPMTINPRTAPAASQQNKPSKTHSSTPSLWRRFASMMYEGILLFGVIFLASYLFDTLTQSRSGMTLRHGRQAVVFIAIGIYFIMCWRVRARKSVV